MEIKRIARLADEYGNEPILDNPEDVELDLEDLEDIEEIEIEDTEEEFSLEDVSMSYIDPKTGLSKLDNRPTEIKANDGMDMLAGTIKVEGLEPESLSDNVYKGTLVDMILEFINSDMRVRIDEDSLVTRELKDEGIVSFLVAPAFKIASQKDNLMKAANTQEIQKKVDKAYKSFFRDLGDLETVNINKINKELFELAEKVSFLSNIEKLKLRNKIRKKLKEEGITLTYLEVNR
jgi:hypothetical protein